MAKEHILHRSERIRTLKGLLKEKRIIYLSAFFYSGKTVLLDQLATALASPVKRFDAEKDDWKAFEDAVRSELKCTLLIDSLQAMTDPKVLDALSNYLSNLPKAQTAVLAGRAQLPPALETLCATGDIHILGKDFVLFDEEEICQLFLDYGLELKPSDIAFFSESTWGWPVMMHNVANRLLKDPSRPVRAMREDVLREFWDILIRDVFLSFPEQERLLLFKLAPFERFTGEMAQMITGRANAPEMMSAIAQKSYMLLRDGNTFYFVPFVRDALFHRMRTTYDQEYINSQYRRAALYYELVNQVPEAMQYYILLKDIPKIRELLIHDTQMRPSNGDYVELKPAYDLLSEKDIIGSPELMKGMCMIESLSGHIDESERWYAELQRYSRNAPMKDAQRQAAQEALAYLDIGLAHRGTKDTLKILIATVKLNKHTDSNSWQGGFNIAGNSASLMNGGKDFSRWVPHGWNLYRLFKAPIELAVGRAGRGMGDIAIAECELESNYSGDYGLAMRKVLEGQTRISDDLEMRSAAIGIQCRILAAMGQADRASELLLNHIEALPENAPQRMRQNLTVQRLIFEMLQGQNEEAVEWLNTRAPDETRRFIILDRYGYLLKLRLYILTGQWDRITLLAALLSNYFDSYDRPYMRTQLHLLQALAFKRSGQGDWRAEIQAACALARRYKLVRVIADEGDPILSLLLEVHPQGRKRDSEIKDPWLKAVLDLTRRQARNYPRWMQSVAQRPTFTDREYQVYTLMIAGRTNAEIAAALNRQERTIKRNVTSILDKLGVKTRTEAVSKAAELGDI